MSTQDILDHHLHAFASGDVDEIMKDYTETSLLMTPDGTLRGSHEIRSAMEEFFGGLFRPGTYAFEMDRMEVNGEVAFIAWHSSNEGSEVPLGTDTFLVRDGKIAVQTFAASIVTGK